MIKVIINADDCGYSKLVDDHIANAIRSRKITSTTMMANMNDFEGALVLYDTYKDEVSFGFHLNLTEGTPLLKNQELLDIGFYQEKDGLISFNGNAFRRKLLSVSARNAIYREIEAQVSKLQDSGVVFSHLDGHHFIHQAVFMLPLLPKLCKQFRFTKVRNYRNYMPSSLNKYARQIWGRLIRIQNPNIKFTDYFVDYKSFHDIIANGNIYHNDGQIVELMCHPGGIYHDEEALLMAIDAEAQYNCKLINYNEL